MDRRTKFLRLAAIIVGVVLLHVAPGATAATLDLDHRIRAEFPTLGKVIGVSAIPPASAVREMATAGPRRVRGFGGLRFGDGYRIDSGASVVALQPELSPGGVGSAGAFGTSYPEAFPGIDAFRMSADAAETEVLIVETARDAAAIAYRVTSSIGVAEIVNDGRGIRFVSGNGPDTFLSAPVTIDSSGKPSYETRWEVDRTDRGAVATLRLRIRGEGLEYPVAIAYAPGRAVLSSSSRVEALATGSVSGVVQQSGGGAIAGALVYLFDSAGEFVDAAITDAAGGYTIAGLGTDAYRALATAEDRTPQLYSGINCPDFNCSPIDGTPITVTDGASTTGINFALTSNAVSVATIAGTVTGPGASPLEGVTVVLFDGSGVAVDSTSSDASGAYQLTLDHSGSFYARTFNGLYPGLVDSLYAGINCTACNPTSGTVIAASLGSTTGNVNFALVSGGRISGTVTDAFDASPLPARQVTIYNASGIPVTSASSDDAGAYVSFNGLVAGTYYALASAAGYFPQVYDGIDCASCAVTGGTPISVTLGSTVSAIDFGLHSSQAIVAGTVTDAVTSAPLGGVLIVFYNASGQQVLATTSDYADGAYEIHLPAAGRYYAATQNGLQQSYVNQLYSGLDCSGCVPTSGTPIDVVLGVPFSGVNFALNKAGGKISGTILDATTAAPAEYGFVQVFSATGVLAAHGFSDPSGQYTVSDGLAAGNYYVIGRAPNYVSVLYSNIPCSTGCSVTGGTAVAVASGQTTSGINFNLSATTAVITGRVLAAGSATPLAGVEVGIFNSVPDQVGSGITDASGNYSITLASGGTYFARTVSIEDPQYHHQLWNHLSCEDCDPRTGSPISVSDGTTTANINFDLHTTACPAITLTPSSLPSTTVGASYSQQLSATGAAPFTFTISSGAPPAGITLASSGNLSGSASNSGSSTFVVTATDANGCTGSESYTINVSASPTTTSLSATPASGAFGTLITLTAAVSPTAAAGNVTFYDGGTILATVPLSGASASTSVASLTAGTHTLTAAYGGSANYAPSTSAAVQVTITKATPLITWPPPAAITYGTQLSAAQLNASANVPGSFVYTPVAGTILNAGTHVLAVDFTPADTTNYNSASATVSLTVNKASQQITWSNPADIVYGTSLGAAQLNATVTVPGPSPAGALTYSPAAGTILAAGPHTLSVTAAETTNYNEAGASVTINVTKATPSFSNVTAPIIAVGTPAASISGVISAGTLIPTGSVTIVLAGTPLSVAIQPDGSFSASFPTAGLAVGVYAVALTYGGDSNFNPAAGSSTLTVSYGVTGEALQQAPANAGSTIPFRVMLTDAQGNNLSSSSVALTAYGVQLIGTSTWIPIPHGTGTAFRFQKVSGGSYVFNLKTTGLTSGAYVLGFIAAGDPTIHAVAFDIR